MTWEFCFAIFITKFEQGTFKCVHMNNVFIESKYDLNYSLIAHSAL